MTNLNNKPIIELREEALSLGIPRRAIRYAALCSLFSVLGGLLGYFIGWGIWEVVKNFFLTYIIRPEHFQYVAIKYQENAFLAVTGAALTPIPYKVFTIGAGVFKVDIFTFVAASIIGRSARFFLEGGAIYFFGEGIKVFIDRYFNLLVIIFFALIVLGFLFIKILVK